MSAPVTRARAQAAATANNSVPKDKGNESGSKKGQRPDRKRERVSSPPRKQSSVGDEKGTQNIATATTSAGSRVSADIKDLVAVAETFLSQKSLDPWSDDGCRDYVLSTCMERLAKPLIISEHAEERDTVRVFQDVVSRIKLWIYLFGGLPTCTAPPNTEGKSHHTHLSSLEEALLRKEEKDADCHTMEVEGKEELRDKDGFLLPDQPPGIPVLSGEGEDSNELKACESGTAIARLSTASTASAGSVTRRSGSSNSSSVLGLVSPRQERLLLLAEAFVQHETGREVPTMPGSSEGNNPVEEAAKLPPGLIEVIYDMVAYLRSMLVREVVLERFTVKELAFILCVLRRQVALPPSVSLRREGLLIDIRNHYYELMKSPRREALAQQKALEEQERLARDKEKEQKRLRLHAAGRERVEKEKESEKMKKEAQVALAPMAITRRRTSTGQRRSASEIEGEATLQLQAKEPKAEVPEEQRRKPAREKKKDRPERLVDETVVVHSPVRTMATAGDSKDRRVVDSAKWYSVPAARGTMVLARPDPLLPSFEEQCLRLFAEQEERQREQFLLRSKIKKENDTDKVAQADERDEQQRGAPIAGPAVRVHGPCRWGTRLQIV